MKRLWTTLAPEPITDPGTGLVCHPDSKAAGETMNSRSPGMPSSVSGWPGGRTNSRSWFPVYLLFLALLLLSKPSEAQTPKMDVPPVYRGAASDGPSIGNLKWFEVFQDPQLQELVRTAEVHNADVQTAVATVQLERAGLGLARADQAPQVQVGADVDTSQNSANGPNFFPGANIPRTRTFGEVVLNLLSFEIDVWGRLRHLTEAAKAQLKASEADQQAIMATVLGDVSTAYFNLLELDAELEVDQRTLAARGDSLGLIKLREAHGLATMLEVRQAEQLVEVAAQAIPDTQRRIAQTENQMHLLLGSMPGSIPRGKPLTEQALLPDVPAGLPSELLQRRPDIQEAEQKLVAQHAQLQAVRAAYLPRFTLTSLFGFQSTALSSLIGSDSRQWGVNPGVTYPLFNGGRTHAANQQASANQQLALIDYQRTVLTAFREVSDALLDVAADKDLTKQQEELVATLQDRSRLSYLRYRGGVDSLLNALDADRDLFSAQLGLAQARRNQLVALVQLYKALGGGWSPEPAAASHKSD